MKTLELISGAILALAVIVFNLFMVAGSVIGIVFCLQVGSAMWRDRKTNWLFNRTQNPEYASAQHARSVA